MNAWKSIRFRDREFSLGDEVVITVQPGAEVYQGFLNEIAPGYISLAATGFEPVQGFGGTLGFPMTSITRMDPA